MGIVDRRRDTLTPLRRLARKGTLRLVHSTPDIDAQNDAAATADVLPRDRQATRRSAHL